MQVSLRDRNVFAGPALAGKPRLNTVRMGRLTPESGVSGLVHTLLAPSPERFIRPEPSPLMIASMNHLADYWLQNALKVNKVVFATAQDKQRLVDYTSMDYGTFITPNHPNYFGDLLMSKYLSSRFFPDMLAWAHSSFVNASWISQWFFKKNNTLAHSSGEAGKKYTIDQLLQGGNTVIFPEGAVRWTGDKIQPLFLGVPKMALCAAKQSEAEGGKPIVILPVSWRYRFHKSSAKALHNEMEWIEQRLKLPRGQSPPQVSVTLPFSSYSIWVDKLQRDQSVAERFAQLQLNLLRRAIKRHGLPENLRESDLQLSTYFNFQSQYLTYLFEQFENKFGSIPPTTTLFARTDIHHTQPVDETKSASTLVEKLLWCESRLSKLQREGALPPEESREGKRLLQDLKNLVGFMPQVYHYQLLTQEQIAESLKRICNSYDIGLCETGWLRKHFMPVPVDSMYAEVTVAEPIHVNRLLQQGLSDEEIILRIGQELKTNLQDKLVETRPLGLFDLVVLAEWPRTPENALSRIRNVILNKKTAGLVSPGIVTNPFVAAAVEPASIPAPAQEPDSSGFDWQRLVPAVVPRREALASLASAISLDWFSRTRKPN